MDASKSLAQPLMLSLFTEDVTAYSSYIRSRDHSFSNFLTYYCGEAIWSSDWYNRQKHPLTNIEWLLLLQQYSNFKLNHGCDYYHYIITFIVRLITSLHHGYDYYHYIILFIDRLITLPPIEPLGLTMDAVISSPSKSLGSPRKCT